MLESQIEEVLKYQMDYIEQLPDGTHREIAENVKLSDAHVKILTGIRRCGKSTAMLQIARRLPHFNYISFEDPRLSAFEVSDFFKLERIFEKTGSSDLFFFDEIQNVEAWERYVRVLQDKKQQVIDTGSKNHKRTWRFFCKQHRKRNFHITNWQEPLIWVQVIRLLHIYPISKMHTSSSLFHDSVIL